MLPAKGSKSKGAAANSSSQSTQTTRATRSSARSKAKKSDTSGASTPRAAEEPTLPCKNTSASKRPRAGSQLQADTPQGKRARSGTVSGSISTKTPVSSAKSKATKAGAIVYMAPDVPMNSDDEANEEEALARLVARTNANAGKKKGAGNVALDQAVLNEAFAEESDGSQAGEGQLPDEDEDDSESDSELQDEIKVGGGKLAARFAAERPHFAPRAAKKATNLDSEPAENQRALPPRLQRNAAQELVQPTRKAATPRSGKMGGSSSHDTVQTDDGLHISTTSERSSPASESGLTTGSKNDIEIVGHKKISETVQPPRLQHVLELAKQFYYFWSIKNDPFADVLTRSAPLADAIRKAAKQLRYNDVYDRVCGDNDYLKKLIYVPHQRWTVARGMLKADAVKGVVAAYRLNIADSKTCREQVEELLTRDEAGYLYVFAEMDSQAGASQTFTANLDKPYLHPFLLQLLRNAREIAVGHKALLPALEDDLRSESPDEDLKIPVPLLALAATAIHAALMDYETGKFGVGSSGSEGKEKGVAFSADRFRAAYIDHLDTLDSIKNQPETCDMFDPLLAKIWRETYGAAAASRNRRAPSSTSNLAVKIRKIDLN
ncbi:hypothetical protein BXZ70DRAFT_938824 [Cristinia sonorae]|uniref:DUF6532 domain-containing protein n=1 Tax=Cristinia sonorae TaxID=1940300 RepID=A0A8K0UMG9_9AGAR|nr:hypothetical protein BXZ70DRAFT_938824 [Cristinia sonorae]